MSPFTKSWIFPVLVVLLLCAFAMWSGGGDAGDLTNGSVNGERQVQQLRSIIEDFGPLAPLVYVLFVTAEVVIAPIPGLMLYAPGGILFGPFCGGLLALTGNVLGAGIAASVTRALGNTWLTRFFDNEKLERVQSAIESHGVVLILLLRLNPLTSSDIVSYAAGLTRIPVWKVMFATCCGMAPLCFAQAWLAESLLTSFPQLIFPLAAACAVYLVVVIATVRRLCAQ